jgi:hypothetical protein
MKKPKNEAFMKKMFALSALALMTVSGYADPQSQTTMADVKPRSAVAPTQAPQEELGFEDEDVIILEEEDEDSSFTEIVQN